MDELRFVGKCFVFAALILMVSQIKTKNGTIETEIQATLTSSQTAHLVNKVASGGVKAIKNVSLFIKDKISSSSARSPSNSEVEDKMEAAVVDTKAAVHKIEQKVKAEVRDLDEIEIEELEELE